MAEILLANQWLGTSAPAEGFASIGAQADDGLVQVAWGRKATTVLGIASGSDEVSVHSAATVSAKGTNLAGEPRDRLAVSAADRQIQLADAPYAQLALARVNLMAGCLQAVLDLGLQFAAERSQFGRSISKFQAIQHSLAVVAAEVAASQRAADAGVDAMGTERFEQEVAAAKARVGEAVGIVAEQVHQVHGAMGYTYEHRLHHFTRRLWAWRDEWGNEFYWQAKLGQHLAGLGAEQVWGYIATPS
jgi:alkylation response protein AidB-like acyl-CoA dehydrogenase